MKSHIYRSAAPLITRIQKLFSHDLAKENDFLHQENKILRSKLGILGTAEWLSALLG